MEKWLPIRDFPNYMVSDLGRVKSIERDYKYGFHKDIILRQNDRKGYKGVTLFKDGKRYYKAVHRLVGEAFIPNPYKLPIINHKNEIKSDNRTDNLEWCTRIYNARYGNSRKKISIRVSRKVEQMSKDGTVIKIWDSMTKASKETGAQISEISKSCKNNKYSAGGFKWRKAQ